jgi:photosystem II stability/assembly factor-like uncharacterized protein
MKKIYIILALFITVNVQGQWIQQQSNQTLDNLQSVYFLDSLKGFIVGYSYPGSDTSNILITTNGGDNWTILQNYPNRHFYNITFSNSITGYIASTQGAYLKSTNSGLNWVEKNIGVNADLFRIYFINKDTGFAHTDYIVPTNSPLMATFNGGDNWVEVQLPNINQNIKKIEFLNSKTGFIVSSYSGTTQTYGYVLKTTNSGLNWNILYQNGSQLNTFSFKDSLHGFAGVLNEAYSYFTSNGGLSWISSSTNYVYANDAKYLSSGKLIFVGMKNGGVIYSSTNSGGNWVYEKQVNIQYSRFNSVYFINSNTGWTVGAPKLIYKTTNGGLTFTESTINVIPDKYSLQQNYPNPFNPTTKISFALPKQGLVMVKVFDVLGKEIETLVNESLKPGTYEAAFDGSNYPSGVYFYRLTVRHGGPSADGFTETKRMVLIK